MNCAVVLAAGKSSRASALGAPKQLLPLGGAPVAAHSVTLFCAPQIDCVLLVGDEANRGEYAKVVREAQAGFAGRVAFCPGGATRALSLCRAAAWIEEHLGPRPDDLVLTHDAARPFCPREVVFAHLEAAKAHDAIATVVESPDTLALVDGGFLASVLPRRRTMALQTPQSLKWWLMAELYLRKDDSPDHVDGAYTDACGPLLARGAKVFCVQGSPAGFKLTTPRDYAAAIAFWAKNAAEK